MLARCDVHCGAHQCQPCSARRVLPRRASCRAIRSMWFYATAHEPSRRSTSPWHGCASKLVLSFIRPTGCARPHSALRSKHRRRAPCRIAHDAGAPAVSMQCLSGLWAVLHAQTSECTTYIRITFSSSVHFCSGSPSEAGLPHVGRACASRRAKKVLGFPKFVSGVARTLEKERPLHNKQHRPLAAHTDHSR